MSLFGSLVNKYCDNMESQADDLICKGQIKRGDAIRNGTWSEDKQELYDKTMSKIKERKALASNYKDFNNHLHDDKY